MWVLFCLAFAEPVGSPDPDPTSTGTEQPTSPSEETDDEQDTPDATPASEAASEETGPEDEPETYELPTLDFELPSALETNSLEAPEDDGSFEQVVSELGPMAYGFGARDYKLAKLLQGGLYLRPRLAFSQLIGSPGPIAMRLGATLGYRFGGRARTVQWTGDVNLRATAPVGGASGHRVELNGHVGPWVSVVRLQVGVHMRWERERWRRKLVEAENALYLGPSVQFGLDARYVQFLVGVAPTWRLAGNRPPASAGDPVFPDFANETTWLAGIAVPLKTVRLQADASWRDTEIGGLFEVSAGFHVQLPQLLGSMLGGTTEQEQE